MATQRLALILNLTGTVPWFLGAEGVGFHVEVVAGLFHHLEHQHITKRIARDPTPGTCSVSSGLLLR